MNPLFPDDYQQGTPVEQKYLLKRVTPKVQPVSDSHEHRQESHDANQAADLIRRKLDAIYADEPNARQEAKEAKAELPRQRSRHQQFMYELSTSGKPLAYIQTAWHEYYTHLPDAQKHEVWQEFYVANGHKPSAYTSYVQQQATAPRAEHPVEDKQALQATAAASAHAQMPPAKAVVSQHHVPAAPKFPAAAPDRRKTGDVKRQILARVRASEKAQIKAKQHAKSLAFGIGCGALAILIFLFGFFNEVIVTPFIQPSSKVGSTPIILTSDSVAATDTPEIIIPKINVEIPAVYDEPSVDEAAIQHALERGVIHYATTPSPGQKGNAAFFGHSSNNIFNKGKYKFAFVFLHTLEPGDLFYLTYNKQVYAYRVFKKTIVPPDDVSVLNPIADKTATATLITCDPPGTSNNRLVVVGEQISPDPTGATTPATPTTGTATATTLPDNGPSMWSRFTGWLF